MTAVSTTAELTSVAPAILRDAMSRLATGVTVVTSHDGGPVGTTANAVTSLSLDPPLLLVCLDRRSTTLAAIRSSGTFAVNVLADHHQDVSANFARPGGFASWDQVAYEVGDGGSPLIDGTLTAVECEVEQLVGGGDHEIVIGRVQGVRSPPEPAAPLLFWRGRYAGLDPGQQAMTSEGRAAALARELEATGAACALPTRDGLFHAIAHMTSPEGQVMIALIHGERAIGERVLVHAHSACLLGDTFDSRLCDCRSRLEQAADDIARAGAGVILYCKPLSGMPLVCGSTNRVDSAVAAALLRHAGVTRVRLTEASAGLTGALGTMGIDVDSGRT